MPTWLVLSLLSMAVVGTADLVLRRAAIRGVAPGSFMVLQSWFFGSTALTWAVATGSVRWSRGILFGPVAGVLAFVATYAFLRSLQAPQAQVSVNAAIYRLNLAVTAVLAIVLVHEGVTAVYKLGVTFGAPPALLIFGQFAALTTISFFYTTWREGGLHFTRTIWPHAPVCGALNASGRVQLASALISGEASAAVPVSQMSFGFTFCWPLRCSASR